MELRDKQNVQSTEIDNINKQLANLNDENYKKTQEKNALMSARYELNDAESNYKDASDQWNNFQSTQKTKELEVKNMIKQYTERLTTIENDIKMSDSILSEWSSHRKLVCFINLHIHM